MRNRSVSRWAIETEITLSPVTTPKTLRAAYRPCLDRKVLSGPSRYP